MSSSQWSFPRTSYFHLQLWTPTWLTLLSFASYSTVTLTLLHPSCLPSNYLSVSSAYLDIYPLQYSWASPVVQLVENPPVMQETWVWSLGWEDSLGEWKGYSFQYSGLENSIDCIVHGVAKSQKQLSDFHFHYLDIELWIYPIYGVHILTLLTGI